MSETQQAAAQVGTPDLVRRCVTEFMGTFVLVFTVCCAGLTGADLGALAIGASLMVVVFAGGHISGAHYNPAVSFAVMLRGRLEPGALVPYWVSQLLGGALGAGVAQFVIDPPALHPKVFHGHHLGSAIVAEFVFTLILAYVVLNVATSASHPNNSFYGLAIGFTVFAGAAAVGPISGGVFNPAVGFGVSLVKLSAWGNIWIYVLACLAAGAAAAYLFKFLNPSDT